MKKLKWILIAVLVVFAVIIVKMNIDRIKNGSDGKMKLGRNYYLEDPSGYEEEDIALLKSHMSEIPGMTMYDKQQAGLSPYTYDTDGDCITDADELEMGSDPTKVSTSGDLYPDGYKVINGMDLHTYYDFKDGDLKTEFNECPEVSFDIALADDWYIRVREIPVDESFEGVYKIYRFDGRKQNYTIDLKDVFNENGISFEDISILCSGFYSQGELEECKYAYDDLSVTIDTRLGSMTKYVYIVNKDHYSFSTNRKYQGRAIMFGSPIVRFIFHTKYHIWYSETDNPMLDQLALQRMIVEADDNGDTPDDPDNISYDVSIKSKTRIDVKYKMLQTVLPMFELKDSADGSPRYIVYAYMNYSDLVEADRDDGIEQSKSQLNTRSRFVFSEDALPFGNFASEYRKGGCCAGISVLTAKTFNGNYVPSNGKYEEKDLGQCSWDLSTDSANATLMDAGLGDYKDEDFVLNHRGKRSTPKKYATDAEYLLNKDLSAGEDEFSKMIACYSYEFNDVVKDHADYCYLSENVKYSYGRIEALKEELDNNKIVIAALRTFKLGGHALNIIGYEDMADGSTKLYVYDNNFPYLTDLYILVTPDGHGSFDYIYDPGINDIYRFSSQDIGNMFVLTDDEMNEIGVQIWTNDEMDAIENEKSREKRILYEMRRQGLL